MNIKLLIASIKENKKLQRMLWFLCLALFVLLYIRYRTYKPMKLCYNIGVDSFKMEDYDNAEQYFRYALLEKHTKRQECKIRINEALSITTPITPESVNLDNFDEQIERLETARDILITDGCANKDDSKGHNKKAQKLKEEIEDYIELLKDQKKQQEEEQEKKEQEEKKNNKSGEEQKAKEEEERKAKEQEEKAKAEEERQFKEKQDSLESKFKQIEQEGLKERNELLELYDSYNFDITFNDKNW